MRWTARHFLHLLGGGLGLAGVAFVAQRLYGYAHQIDLARYGAAPWAALLALALLYGAANVLLARAWWLQLRFLQGSAGWRWGLWAYAISQLGKYVPGNIFQFAGRQALGMAAGLPAGPLAKSVVWELGSIALAGALFGVLALPFLWPPLPLWVAAAGFAMLTSAVLLVAGFMLARAVAFAFAWQVVFLVTSGAIFVCTLWLVTGQAPAAPLGVGGAYIVAWLAGLVTPGAPAGIGVREAVLLFLLGSVASPADLLLAVLLGRCITVVGDLVFFLAMALAGRGNHAFGSTSRRVLAEESGGDVESA